MKKLLYILLLSIFFTSCEEYYLPQSDIPQIIETQTTNIPIPLIQIPDNTNVDLQFIWIQLIGDYQDLEGVKLEITNKNDSTICQIFSIIEPETGLFKYNIGMTLEPSNYNIIISTPSNNLISKDTINFTQAYNQDEFIMIKTQACYYFKLNWE